MKGLLTKLGSYLGKHFDSLKSFLKKHFKDFKEFLAKHWKASLAVTGVGVAGAQLWISYDEFYDLFSDISSKFKGILSFLPVDNLLNELNSKIDISVVTDSSFSELINAFGFVSVANIIINGLGLCLGQVIFIWIIKGVSSAAMAKGLKQVITKIPT